MQTLKTGKFISSYKSIRDNWDIMANGGLNFHVVVYPNHTFSNYITVNGNSVRTTGLRKPLDKKHTRNAVYAIRVYPKPIKD